MMGEEKQINMEDQKPNAKHLVCMYVYTYISDFKDALNFDIEAIDWKNIWNLDKFFIRDNKRTTGLIF